MGVLTNWLKLPSIQRHTLRVLKCMTLDTESSLKRNHFLFLNVVWGLGGLHVSHWFPKHCDSGAIYKLSHISPHLLFSFYKWNFPKYLEIDEAGFEHVFLEWQISLLCLQHRCAFWIYIRRAVYKLPLFLLSTYSQSKVTFCLHLVSDLNLRWCHGIVKLNQYRFIKVLLHWRCCARCRVTTVSFPQEANSFTQR